MLRNPVKVVINPGLNPGKSGSAHSTPNEVIPMTEYLLRGLNSLLRIGPPESLNEHYSGAFYMKFPKQQ